jgi:hypothetical protein
MTELGQEINGADRSASSNPGDDPELDVLVVGGSQAGTRYGMARRVEDRPEWRKGSVRLDLRCLIDRD